MRYGTLMPFSQNAIIRGDPVSAWVGWGWCLGVGVGVGLEVESGDPSLAPSSALRAGQPTTSIIKHRETPKPAKRMTLHLSLPSSLLSINLLHPADQ
jgi:hypothetical protein